MLRHLFTDLISLLFPNACNACGTKLYTGEEHICTSCLYDLPYTDFHLYNDNRVARQFWGRTSLNAAMAMLYFKKAGTVQNLIHNLKYNNKQALGIFLGRLIGERIKLNEKYQHIDLIMPVPLHKRKLRSRGYNQSQCIALGIAELLNAPVTDNNLIKTRTTESQTRKARYKRYENLKDAFSVARPEEIRGQHILLVDDVVTTGATLEACATTLLKNNAKSISIAVVAWSE